MKLFKRTFDTVALFPGDIREICEELNRRMVRLENNAIQESQRQTLDSLNIPQELLDAVIQYINTCIEDNKDEPDTDGFAQILDDNDFIEEAIAQYNPVKPLLYFFVEENTIHCCADDCWYTNNRDRVGEHVRNFYNACDVAANYFCDVCFYNLDEECIEDIAFTEHATLVPLVQKAIKKQLSL